MTTKFLLTLALLAIESWLSACAPIAPAATPASILAPTRATGTTLTSPATPAIPTVLPTALPRLHAPASGFSVLAGSVPGLDDLALAPDGSLYVSNVADGTIKSYAPDRAPQTIASELSEPEGIVVLPNGSLIIAEQGRNRLVRYDVASRKLTLLMTLENKTSHPGVDGLALDAHDPQNLTLIIPDSPNGRVLRASLDGQVLGVIAEGLARPTGAAIEKDGSILVVDENGDALKRIHPDGSIELIASLSTPDDVIVDDDGVIYVTTLGDNAVHRFRPGAPDEVLIGSLAGPQGLLLDRAGNLIIAENGGRLISIAK